MLFINSCWTSYKKQNFLNEKSTNSEAFKHFIKNKIYLNKSIQYPINKYKKELFINSFYNLVYDVIEDNASINYSLADPLMIHKVGEVDENVEWKVQATLENEDFNTFVRAAASIQGNEIVTLAATRDTIDTPIIKFVFGERMEFSNKVEFHTNAKFGDDVREDNKIPFNSEMLREIFNANKTSDECHLSFVDDGLLRLVFTAEDEGINTTYFVVRKADY